MNTGSLELRAYKRNWRASRRFRCHAAAGGKRRKEIFAHEDPRTSCDAIGGGFSALRRAWATHDFDMEEEDEPVVVRNGPRSSKERPVSPADVAASLMCARLFDAHPDVLGSMRSAAPVIAIDVSDPDMLEKVLGVWRETLLSPSVRVMNLGERHGGRDSHDLILIAERDVPAGSKLADRQREALWALQVALPIVAISPSAETHVASAILKAAPIRIRFPFIDPATIALTIRVVTGRPCGDLLDEAVSSRVSLEDLVSR
ncbi:hypothetical protein PMN64_00555 [Bradyrhizobium sp. UFLA01-814]|uniref:hypothetical protein n=1 Tax=Bradyrhizobium sp. UFLA01-814 TaxID=3023480 RepID=UPI00398AF7F1